MQQTPPRPSRRLALAGLAVLVASGVAHAQDQAGGADPGAALYEAHCASCHGPDGRGGGASSLVDGVWEFGGEPGTVFRNVKFGIAAAGMPEYGPALDDRQIGSILLFLGRAKQRLGIRDPGLPDTLATRDYDVGVTTWIGADAGLQTPWALTFVDADTALLTERPGRLRVIERGRLREQPVAGTPEVLHVGQGGLLDVAVDPAHAENGWVYLAYSHALPDAGAGRGTPSMTRVVRGRIVENRWVDEQRVWQARPEHYLGTAHHYGSRIAFDAAGHLLFSIGDRGHQDHAQDLGRPNGKVHRVRTDGGIPEDNPFAGREGALPSIWSYGHRNPQGLATHPVTSALWETEHGPMGGDELNVVRPGRNYGWPRITYGRNYNGTEITDDQALPGMEQPTLFWTPSIAVCGMDFVRGAEFPRWDGNVVVTGLAHQVLLRLHVADERVIHQETLLRSHGRVRDVAVAPDGAIHVVLNGPDIVLRLTMEREARRRQ